jgi:uncharacterized phage protein gp47/JayE
MTITSVAPTVDGHGIAVPSLVDIIAYLEDQYRQIFGADVYLGADSQDGQWLAILAAAINDCNNAAVAVYNNFSPASAQGTGLSSMVKLNGLTRGMASYSTVDIRATGVAGTVIRNGVVTDGTQRWVLPAQVVIGTSGAVVATATADAPGARYAEPGSITGIVTPTRGWQAAANPAAATPGTAIETDGALRARQGAAVTLPSRGVAAGIIAGIRNSNGVTAARLYENATGAADANWQAAHSIAVVVAGGDAQTIANVIAAKKTPGTATVGTTTVAVDNGRDPAIAINFYRPTIRNIAVTVHLTAGTGYLSSIGRQIQTSVADYINGLGIGADVIHSRAFVPAQLYGGPDGATYTVTQIQLAVDGGSPAETDITIAYNALASARAADVTLVVAT